MEIRYITENDDFSAVHNIYEESWKFAYKGIIPQEWLESRPKERWGGNILKNGRTDIGVFIDGKIIGTACYCQSRWEKFKDFGEVVAIYLLPEYIGQGIGSALMERCINELAVLGYEKLLLWVLEENTRARKFYEKHGFTLTEEYMDDNIGGRDLREIMYTLDMKNS